MKKKEKLFDQKDLEEKLLWLETLAGYIEWDYPLSYQRHIDKVIKLLREMIKNEKL